MSLVQRKYGFLILLPLLAALSFWQVRVESDLNAFFTASNDADSRLLSGLLQSGELSRRYLIVIEAAQASDNAKVAEFSQTVTERWAKLPGVERVWSPREPPLAWLDAVAAYAPFHAGLFSLNPEQDAASLFAVNQLDTRAEALKQALLSPQGRWLKNIAKQDPLLLSLNGFKNLQNQFQQQAQLDADGGAWLIQSQPAALDSAAHEQLQKQLTAEFEQTNAAAGHAFKLNMAGVPVFSVAAHGEISRDVSWVSTLSSVLVVLVFLLLFRSFAALHWVMLIQMAAFVVGLLATGLLFDKVHSLTLALGASLIGICTDYPIHVLVHSAKHQTPPLAVVKLLWPSLLLGGLTTVIGYVAMGVIGFPGFEQIAVFAVFSISASLALTRWILPALLNNSQLRVAHIVGIDGWVVLCGRYRRAILSVLALLVVGSLAVLPQLRWMQDMQGLALDMSLLKQQDQAVRSHFSSVEPGRFVLVQADDLESALQRAEAAERRLRGLQQNGQLSEFHGLFPWLVSQQLQAQNQTVYQQAVNPAFESAWQVALQKTGLDATKLGHLRGEKQTLSTQNQLQNPAIQQILAGRILQAESGVALALWLGKHQPQEVMDSLQGLEGVRYFSQKDQLDQLASHYRDQSLLMLAMGIVFMALLIWLQQRSLRSTLLTLLPSLASVLFIFATWAVLGEAISFLHVIGLLLSVSLCIDYGIFFMENRGQDSDVTYHALASSTLTTLASFGALGLGKTPTLPILALSVSLGVTVGFLLCPLLSKPIKLQ